MPVHPLEERKLPPSTGTKFGASRSATGRPPECGGGHCGVDLYYWQSGMADKNYGIGRPVFAVAAGRVIAASQSSDGKYVWLQHAGGWRSHYVHLDAYYVKTGDEVNEGQQIGTLGRTGIVTDPAHLHFALSRAQNGSYVYYDPEPDLRVWPLVAGGGLGLLLIGAVMLYFYLKKG